MSNLMDGFEGRKRGREIVMDGAADATDHAIFRGKLPRFLPMGGSHFNCLLWCLTRLVWEMLMLPSNPSWAVARLDSVLLAQLYCCC